MTAERTLISNLMVELSIQSNQKGDARDAKQMQGPVNLTSQPETAADRAILVSPSCSLNRGTGAARGSSVVGVAHSCCR